MLYAWLASDLGVVHDRENTQRDLVMSLVIFGTLAVAHDHLALRR